MKDRNLREYLKAGYELLIFACLFLFSMAVEHLTGLSGGLVGMALFFVLLQLKILNAVRFSRVAPFLLMHIAFFFIPPAAQVVNALEQLEDVVWKLAAMLVLSSMIVMGVTGWVVQRCLRWESNDV